MALEVQDPLIGNTIAGCRIEVKIASGGMGTVYRARSNRLDRDVAVKLLAPSLAADAEYVERFFREARAAASLDHPNVVKVFDSGKDQERYFMVMEYVRGWNLDDVAREEGRLSLERATRIIRDVARGLDAAHAQGLIHRDVKPQNILLENDGTPKITDFGLVRQGPRPSGITMEGVFMGTPEYVSPEQAEGGAVDHRGDLYSLGVTYYQLLSGSYPFQGKTAMEMALARLKEEPRPIENACPGVDPRAAAIIRKLLQKSPTQRYQTAVELIKDLEAILLGQKPKAAADETKESEVRPRVTLEAKRALRVLSFALVLLIALACAAASGAVGSTAVKNGDSYARGLATPFLTRDGSFIFRLGLAAGALISLLGGCIVLRRELSASGRLLGVVALYGAATVLTYAAAVHVEGPRTEGDVGLILSTGRAMGGQIPHGLNVLVLTVTLVFAGVATCWPDDPGSTRRLVGRIMLVGSLVFLYVFAVTGRPFAVPLSGFKYYPEIFFPVATIALVAGIAGLMLLPGYGFTRLTKGMGLVLFLVCATGVLLLATLGARPPGGSIAFGETLAAPFRGLREQVRPTGTAFPLALSAIAAAILLQLAGLRKYARKAA